MRARGVRKLERKINTYIKQGLSQEEAIQKVAHDEGYLLIKKDAKEEEKKASA